MGAPRNFTDLNQKEQALIVALRTKFRFGEVIIIMRDGVPMRLKKVEIFDDLLGDEPRVDVPKKRGVR